MTRHPLAGEQRSTADSANRGRHAVLSEPHTLGGQRVECRRLDDRITRDPQCVMPPIIGIQHEDIHRPGGVLIGRIGRGGVLGRCTIGRLDGSRWVIRWAIIDCETLAGRGQRKTDHRKTKQIKSVFKKRVNSIHLVSVTKNLLKIASLFRLPTSSSNTYPMAARNLLRLGRTIRLLAASLLRNFSFSASHLRSCPTIRAMLHMWQLVIVRWCV